MPKLNRDRIRLWLDEHNWSIRRLAEECSAIGEDNFPEGTMRNAVNGIDPMRPRRIRVISKVMAKYGDGLTYNELTADHTVVPVKPPGRSRENRSQLGLEMNTSAGRADLDAE